MSPGSDLHPDFGPSYGEQPAPYGIPITVVASAHPKVTVRFEYASESDRIPYPLGSDTKVEGGQWVSGDRHTIVVDRDTCRLYETWATTRSGNPVVWRAGSGASWNLKSNALRPRTWTSADAAGLPILPGLLRYDEVTALADRSRHPLHHEPSPTGATCGRPGIRPATRTTWPIRRWARAFA